MKMSSNPLILNQCKKQLTLKWYLEDAIWTMMDLQIGMISC